MDEALKQIWHWMGIPQIWGAVLTILFLAIAFLLKKLIDQLAERHKADRATLNEQFTDIAEYVKEQSVVLIKAYLLIFEGKEALDAQGTRFSEIVEKADNELMEPLRRFSVKLDDETKNKIFYIHNILAQYYPSASHEAMQGLKGRKVEFYSLIDNTTKFLRPDLILNRLGVVSRPLGAKRKV
jgi:predicted transcriptional regulator